MPKRLLLLLLLLGALAAAAFLRPDAPEAAPRARIVGLPTPEVRDTYARVYGPRELVFPADHGPHNDFLTEWWYYTGNLSTADGRRFGYQLTFFRRALEPPGQQAGRASDWAAQQVYMAHFTLTDVQARDFHYFERFERGAAGLAGARGEPGFAVWLRDWSVQQTGPDTYQLAAQAEDIALDLTLLDTKGIILQGDRGYSRKGPQEGNASLYYSQTRLQSSGTVQVGGETFQVMGQSWLDREISTSALSEGQVGWDWFALQLDDGSELMAYVLRRSDGTVDAFSSGSYIAPDGATTPLTREDFRVEGQGVWRSPHSGGEYPARWRVRVPSAGLDLEVTPLLADQELNVSFIYWEGAVAVTGSHTGSGYVELTGYADSLEGDL